MHSNDASHQHNLSPQPHIIPELAHLSVRTPSPAPFWRRPLVEAAPSGYETLTVRRGSPSMSYHQPEQMQQQISSQENEEYLSHASVGNDENGRPSLYSTDLNAVDYVEYKGDHKATVSMTRQQSQHGSSSRFRQHYAGKHGLERRDSVDSFENVAFRSGSYIPSPDNLSAYPYYLHRKAMVSGSDASPLNNRWDMGQGNIELGCPPSQTGPNSTPRGSNATLPCGLVTKDKRHSGPQGSESRLRTSRFAMIDRATLSNLNRDSERNGTAQILRSKFTKEATVDYTDTAKLPLRSCLKQNTVPSSTKYPLAPCFRDGPDSRFTDETIDKADSQFTLTLPIPAHTPAQSWSDKTNAYIASVGARAYDSNTPLHVAEQRYASVEKAISEETFRAKGRTKTPALVSAPQYPVLKANLLGSSDTRDTPSSDMMETWVESPLLMHAMYTQNIDDARPWSNISEPEVLTAIEANIIPVSSSCVRTRSIRRTKGMRPLNPGQPSQQHGPIHRDSGVSMGQDGQQPSQAQSSANTYQVEAPSQQPSLHLQEHQKQLRQNGHARRLSVDQWTGIAVPSPLPAQHIEDVGASGPSDQDNPSPEAATGSSSTIQSRKDGVSRSPKFIERMELDGPAIWSSPSPESGNILDEEYDGEVFPVNAETPVVSPPLDNPPAQEDTGRSKTTARETGNRSSTTRADGTAGKVKKLKDQVKKAWRRIMRAKERFVRVERTVRRLRGCDAPEGGPEGA